MTETSQAVTTRHSASHPVTPSLPVPTRPPPKHKSPEDGEEGNGKPDYSEAYSRILAAYHRLKPRWHSILKIGAPKKLPLSANDKAAIRAAIKAGYSVENIEESLAHVENNAYLMGQTDYSKNPQLTLARVLQIRSTGGKPIDFVGGNLDKTSPDREMRQMIGMHDNRGGFLRLEDLPPVEPQDDADEVVF